MASGPAAPAPSASERLLWRALAPVRSLLESSEISEVVINGPASVFFESGGKLQRAVGVDFEDIGALQVVCNLLAHHSGRVLGKWDFEVDASVIGPPALRIHANLGSVSSQGPVIALRKLTRGNITLTDLETRFGAITSEAREFLGTAINGRRNILVCGGTGTGKTTILQCLSELIPPDDRILIIEDTAELSFRHADVVSLLARRPDPYGEGEVSIRDLFRSSLRMRPDRIIIGEVRGAEAFDLVQALASGHAGSLCTIHAENTGLALSRLHALCLMSDVPQMPQSIRQQISEVIHAVVEVQRLPSGQRVVTAISEVAPSREDGWQVLPVFSRQKRPGGQVGELERAGSVPRPGGGDRHAGS